MCTGQKELAAKNTDGKAVPVENKKLSGDAYDKAVAKGLGGASECATGGGRVVFGKCQTGDSAPSAGAGPSKATRAVRADGSAPGRA